MMSRAEELIELFDFYDGTYRRSEVDEAVALQDEITPLLLRVIEEVAADPETWVEMEHYCHLYAASLLAFFREPAAHLPILRSFSLPFELLDPLWGDMVTESLPSFLFRTCNGSLEAIKEMVLDRNAYDYARGAAAQALTYAVTEGMVSREEIVGFLSGMFTGEEAAPESDFWNEIACTVADLHPEGAMEPIRKAFAEGLIRPGYVTLQEIEDELAKDRDEVLEDLRRYQESREPETVHDYLAWMEHSADGDSGYSPVLDRSRKKKKKANRSKRKMAKKSKKKNRK